VRVPGNARPAGFQPARQIAIYLANHVGDWSTTGIGRLYNERDHSTVCHAIRQVESMREHNHEHDVLLSGPRSAAFGHAGTALQNAFGHQIHPL
jgi:chromosomal replication initiation ATPase DnaA